MANFEEDTKQLKTLINNTKKSGKEAWKAGELLFEIDIARRYKSIYKNFNQYTKKEFGINGDTAQKYIKIYQLIPIKKITDNMLVSHLYTITEMKEKFREEVLDILALEGKANGDKETPPYDGDIVIIFKNILESAKSSLDKNKFKEIFNFIKQLDAQENKRRENSRRNPLKDAIKLQELSVHNKYKPTLNLYQLAPISEQGLVGLFCTIFHLLQKEKFTYKDYTINFEQIIYIRTEYPDAKIGISKSINPVNNTFGEKDECKMIDIEFELNSFNYWRHKHHQSSENCDMIICWKMDKLPIEVEIPPVLCLKDVLESGKIKLFDSIQN